MTDGINFPMFVVSNDDSGDVLVSAEDVEGFFVVPEDESPDVILLGVHDVDRRRRQVENAVLQVVNQRGDKIGDYYIGRVILVDTDMIFDRSPSSVVCRYFGNRCEYSAARRIWRRWASGTALSKGEWLQWPSRDQSAWLHVVQNSWFASGRDAVVCNIADVVYLDGAHIAGRSAFFCELGEAVSGPGGYFGSNLDALADCIRTNSVQGRPRKVVWRDFQSSREFLDDAFVDSVKLLMHDFRVELLIE
ncbi:barstar family protein [Kribbella endophytica]